jgi:LTXXQ motif family protein
VNRRSLRQSLASRRGNVRLHVIALASLLIACASSAVAAQGRRRGSAPDQSAPARVTVAPVLWEPDQIFPLAVARANELKLSDEQRGQIETIASKLRASNAPILLSIDTLRPPPIHLPDPNNPSEQDASPTPARPTPEQIAVIVAKRHALGEARAQIRENIRVARDQLTQLLTPDQQLRLQAMENSARTSAERGDPGAADGAHAGARVGRNDAQGRPRR